MPQALGRLFNVVPIAAGAGIALKGGEACTFVCTGDDSFTLSSSASLSTGYTTLAAITRYYTNTSTAGAAAWVDSGDLGAAVGSVTIASGAVVFAAGTDDLPAGARYVKVTPGGPGLVAAIVHELDVQRAVANLPALSS
jgi:hypothetical protein